MTNLYKYELNLKTGEITRKVVEDVIIVDGLIVRGKYRDYDLNYGGCNSIVELGRFMTWKSLYNHEPIDIIRYISLDDDIDIEKMKDVAIKIIAIEIEERQNLISQIIVSQIKN